MRQLDWLVRSLVLLALAPLSAAQIRLVRQEASIPSGVPGGGDQSASRVADLDGDGIGEIAFGLPRANDGGPGRGAVQILFVNHCS